MKLKFYREEDNKWYVNLPGYPGDKEELEMILGADQMLDNLSNYTDNIELDVDIEPLTGTYIVLNKQEEDDFGATYTSAQFDFPIWLCAVTVHIFKHFPDKIYIK